MSATSSRLVRLVILGGILATLALLGPTLLRSVFYPPEVELTEAHASAAATATFDHQGFDAVLRRFVDERGSVDYAGLAADPDDLDRYVEALQTAPFDQLSRDGKLALLLNAYNACTLRLILDHYPLASIRDIPARERWADVRWTVGGRLFSLEQIEHVEIRGKFRDARIHFALVCASIGCPPLRQEAYAPDRLETQLAEQANLVHSDARWFTFDAAAGELQLTQLYDWYSGDFVQLAGSVEEYAAQFAPALATALEADDWPSLRWLQYDWTLNGR